MDIFYYYIAIICVYYNNSENIYENQNSDESNGRNRRS